MKVDISTKKYFIGHLENIWWMSLSDIVNIKGLALIPNICRSVLRHTPDVTEKNN